MPYCFGSFVLDEQRFELRSGGAAIPLRRQAFDVLLYLVRNSGRTVPAEELLARLWTDRSVTANSVSQCISTIRAALRKADPDNAWITTRPGRGFLFVGGARDGVPDADIFARHGFGHPAAIAVLPFRAATPSSLPGAEDGVFGRGLAAEVVRRLAVWRVFPVISASSTWSYDRGDRPLDAIGADLGCTYVVEGIVHRVASRIRVAVHLSHAPSGREIAGTTYDASADDCFDLQDAVADEIATSLHPELLRSEMLAIQRLRWRSMDAWQLTVRGISYLLRNRRRANALAIAYFDRACRADWKAIQPAFWLGYSRHLAVYLHWAKDPVRELDAVRSAADRCLRLDPADGSGHLLSGLSHLVRGEAGHALDALNRAVDANPNDAIARSILGQILGMSGKGEEAVRHAELALALSPRDPRRGNFLTSLAIGQFVSGDYAKAAETAERAAAREPYVMIYPLCIAASAALLDDDARARAAAHRVRELVPEFSTDTLARMIATSHPDVRSRFWTGLRRSGLITQIPA